MPKSSKTEKQRSWAEAQRRCRLSDEALRMAKELGLNPRSLIKNIPSTTQRWKAPVEEWVRHLHRRRFSDTPRHGKATGQADPANTSRQPQAGPTGTGQLE
jgi:hypothetical protein